jgi:hypothetical protein
VPPGAGSPATGAGATAWDATALFTANISVSGTPPAAWNPACTVLPPFGMLACSLGGFGFPRADMAPGTLQVEVFDQNSPASNELSSALPVGHYQIEQITDFAPDSTCPTGAWCSARTTP